MVIRPRESAMADTPDDRWKVLLVFAAAAVVTVFVMSWLDRVWLRKATRDGQPGSRYAHAIIGRVVLVVVLLALVGLLVWIGF